MFLKRSKDQFHPYSHKHVFVINYPHLSSSAQRRQPSSVCFTLLPLCASSHSLLVVRATVTKESGGSRRKETRATDFDATIFNSSARRGSVSCRWSESGLGLKGHF